MRFAPFLFLLLVLAGCTRHVAPREREISLWYWHSPFRLTPEERAELGKMGVRRLFVRAGTMSFDGERLVPSMPQRWEGGGEGLGAHLVLRFDAGAVGHFGEIANSELARTVAAAFRGQRTRAEAKGLRVEGCQLDLDCPTRLLPKYAGFLRELRAELGKGTQISITGLPTWLSSGDLEAVVRELDFFVPQFYEGSVPRTVGDRTPLADVGALRRGLETLERLGVRYYVGLPAYGRAIMYDERGRMAGIFGGLGAHEAVRHPSFVVEEATLGPEERLQLRAVRAGRDGRGLGYRLVYRLPTAGLVAEHLQVVERENPAECLGAVIFRVPEAGESMAIPLRTLRAAVRGEQAVPDVRISTRSRSAPFAAIESGKAEALVREATVRVENVGDGGSALTPGALTLVLRFPPGALEEGQPGGFDALTPFVGDPVTAGSVSAGRADGLLARRARLAAGEAVTLGPVRLRSEWVEVRWRVKGQDGQVREGRAERVRLGGKG